MDGNEFMFNIEKAFGYHSKEHLKAIELIEIKVKLSNYIINEKVQKNTSNN